MTKNAELRLTHIGGPTVLIEVGKIRLLTDPTLDASGETYTIPRVGAQTTKLLGPAVPATALGSVDAVLLSHDEHADNLDNAGRAFLAHVGTTYTTPGGAQRLGGSAVGLAPWQSAELGGVTITAVPARHGPPGCEPLLGDVIGFVLTWDGQGDGGLYISGDTVWYDDVAEVATRIPIGTAIMHIGRVELPDGTRFTMSAADAAAAARKLGVQRIIPVHYDGWAHFTEGRDAAQSAFHGAGIADRVRWLEPGEPTSV